MVYSGFQHIYKVLQPSPWSNSRTFSLLQKEIHYPREAISQFLPIPDPSRQLLNELSVSMALLILDILYKWNFTICGLLFLASFIQYVFKVHPCCSLYQNFIHFYGRIIFHCMYIPIVCLSIHQLTYIWVSSPFQLL